MPVCWPQFNDLGPGPSHGFARNTAFRVKELKGSSVVMELTSDMVDQEKLKPYGYDFVLRVTVAVSDDHDGSLTQAVREA